MAANKKPAYFRFMSFMLLAARRTFAVEAALTAQAAQLLNRTICATGANLIDWGETVCWSKKGFVSRLFGTHSVWSALSQR
jgi:hypothetical protein